MKFLVNVYTGDRPRAGTNANVRILFRDEHGAQSPEYELDTRFKNDFERGDVNDFRINMPSHLKFGLLKEIEVWRDDSGLHADWYVDRVSVDAAGKVFQFPVFRWIKPNHHYLIQHLDTALPQFDEHKQQRQSELDDKRKQYQLEVRNPGLLPQVTELPEDENFSNDYRWNLEKLKIKLGLKSFIIEKTTDKWDDLDSLKNVYVSHQMPEPRHLPVWDKDSHFGNLRVADINPVLIKLCTEIPDKFGVTEEMAAPFLEGLSLTEAIAQKRLFIVDLDIMNGVPGKTEEFVVCAPIALFFETKDKQLLPVAIQLFQTKGSDNPVFLPSDPPFTWLLAKMWYNNADASHHQAITHLGFTHLIMEAVCVVTHRNLSQSHPIFKLLAPHFLYLLAINTRALSTLLVEGGYVDTVQSTGVKGSFHLIAKRLTTWRMDVDGTFPEALRARGLLDPDVLSYYPYRDDGLLVYNAVKSYVEKIVSLYYDSPEKLADDYEIQAWAKELVKPRDEGGCGIMGVDGNGHFSHKNQLIMVLTSILCTCSIAHAASNFPQYHTYAFPPNYPLLMKGRPPKDKAPRTEEDVVAALADKGVTMKTMVVATILSQHGTNPLGDFEVNYVFDPDAVEIVESFRKDLDEVGAIIRKRIQCRRYPYEWMDPSLIPNSISI